MFRNTFERMFSLALCVKRKNEEREKIVILMWRDQKRELNLNSMVLLSADSALATNIYELQLNHI